MVQKTIDFGYWGRMKHGNDREKTIKNLSFRTINCDGWWFSICKETVWFGLRIGKNYPLLEPARCTLCFNWIDQTATTSRYPEALSIGMIPFVWQDYDSNNTYNIDSWQPDPPLKRTRRKGTFTRNQIF